MATAVCFGEVLWDVIDDVAHLGGAPLNLAAHFRQLGGNAIVVSTVGDDELGRRLLAETAALGLSTDFIGVDNELPTGTVDVFLTAGQPSYTINEPVAWDRIRLRRAQVAALTAAQPEVICFGSLASRQTTSRATLHELLAAIPDCPRCCDLNLRAPFYDRAAIERALAAATILKLNDQELAVVGGLLGLTGSEAEQVRQLAAGWQLDPVIITKAELGCVVYDHSGCHECPGMPVTVVDAVGAGDAFAAAFLIRYLGGDSAAEAATAANRVGAFVAGCAGAVPPHSAALQATFRGPA